MMSEELSKPHAALNHLRAELGDTSMPNWVAGEAGRQLALGWLLETDQGDPKAEQRDGAAKHLGKYAAALAREYSNEMLYKELRSFLSSLKNGESSRQRQKTGQIRVVVAAQEFLRTHGRMPTRPELRETVRAIGDKVFGEACETLNEIKSTTGMVYAPAKRTS